MIPVVAPEWTDFNASDPGITLIELFAYLTEALLYRVDRVTDANRRSFVELINGPGWQSHGDVNRDIQRTIASLRRCQRAVTPQDFETLALEVNLGRHGEAVARAHCIGRRNLESAQQGRLDAPGHVTLVILSDTKSRPSPELLGAVQARIEPARLITTRVHVVGVRFVRVGVQVTLLIEKGAQPGTVQAKAVEALTEYFDALHGGTDGFGWPFGRAVYVSEVYSILSRIPGVRAVVRTVESDGSIRLPELVVEPEQQFRLVRNRSKEIEAVQLAEDELVEARIDPGAIQVRRLNP